MVVVFLGVIAKGQASTLIPEEFLQVTFTADTGACSDDVCDTLIFYPLEDSAFFAGSSSTDVFVNGVLLGEDTEACCIAFFHSASSLFTFGTTINFADINAGDVVTLDLTLSSGAIGWSGSPAPDVFLGDGTPEGGATANYDQTVTSEIITPEPSTFWLPSLGMGVLGLRRRLPFRWLWLRETPGSPRRNY